MDKFGQGKEIRLTNLGATQNPSFLNFTMQMFRQICILAGCDYLNSIPGMGVKKAHSLMKKFRSAERVIQSLRANKKYIVPDNYEENFRKAELTFLHQRVFDHRVNRVVPLNPLPQDLIEQDTSFFGPEISPEQSLQIAVGNINPHTLQPYFSPSLTQMEKVEFSLETEFNMERTDSLIKTSSKPNLILPIQKNTVTNYFTPVTIATKKPFVPPRNRSIIPEEEVSPLKKRKKEENETQIIAPRTPSPPHRSKSATLIISKYFTDKGEKMFTKDVLQNSPVNKKQRNKDVSTFESPFINSDRISIDSNRGQWSKEFNIENVVQKVEKATNDWDTSNFKIYKKNNTYGSFIGTPNQLSTIIQEMKNDEVIRSDDEILSEEEVICSDQE